ncbi:MAG: ABC transporter permease [Anaerolineae bacterium]|nr:ABC transporter permease [Thermoflexus sp.]MDW8064973.1 ABC transporter permease [Anaerolineae bacterium]
MGRYLGQKLLIYSLTFFFAVTIDWLIPRLMPGNPVDTLVSRMALRADVAAILRSYYLQAFQLDLPLWQQYLNFWGALLRGDLGVSIWLFPQPVLKLILDAVPYDLFLLLPAVILSWIAGNQVGAMAARVRWLDNSILPLGYILTATPYMWLALILAWSLGQVAGLFPIAGAYSFGIRPHLSWMFIKDLLWHWFLPFASLFLVMFGGWAIGMRNMIIYELEADYSRYLESLGAPPRLIRKYAFRNAMLPQITGLALQLGTIVAGAVATEIVFAYPGTGYLILQAVLNQDYFLLQGCFLFIITGVLIANFIIDIIYALVDPRIRTGMTGA